LIELTYLNKKKKSTPIEMILARQILMHEVY